MAMLDWKAVWLPSGTGTGTAADMPPTLGTLGNSRSKPASTSSTGAKGSASNSIPFTPPSVAFRLTSSVSPPPSAPKKNGVAPALRSKDTERKGPFSTSTVLPPSASFPMPPLATHATKVVASNLGRKTSRRFLRPPAAWTWDSATKTMPASKPVPVALYTSSMACSHAKAVEHAEVTGSEMSITSSARPVPVPRLLLPSAL
mmetsp:Transcript_31591/g.73654  ORF Transcript_31591/g.73654 Transcript_31591/m.73654 type:complete len:202 (-) Transcript_31591:349-954(-)